MTSRNLIALHLDCLGTAAFKPHHDQHARHIDRGENRSDDAKAERDGKAAAIRRLRPKGDVRSNISVGATVETATVTPSMRRLADEVAPRLVDDGMFLVGLDIVDDKLLEINVFSPGGMWSANRLHKTDFAVTVIDALETGGAI